MAEFTWYFSGCASGILVKIVQLSSHLGEYIWNEVIASRYNSRIFNPLQASGIPPTEILQNPTGSCLWWFRILPGLTLVLFRNLLPLTETLFRLHRSDHPNGRTSMQFLRPGIPESHPIEQLFQGSLHFSWYISAHCFHPPYYFGVSYVAYLAKSHWMLVEMLLVPAVTASIHLEYMDFEWFPT